LNEGGGKFDIDGREPVPLLDATLHRTWGLASLFPQVARRLSEVMTGVMRHHFHACATAR
jgi:hypothetical protein